MSKPLVLYHANCWDGFCAAWVARRTLGDIEAVPVQYGQDPPDVTGREVFILDFSYNRPVMLDIIRRAKSVVVLDHHKTAEQELAGSLVVEEPQVGYCKQHVPLVRFDMDKSGGRLAWEYFFPDEPSPWLVDYTEDRDLWRWKLLHSRAINAWLRSHPLDFNLWDKLAKNSLFAFDGHQYAVGEGEAILRREQQIITEHVGHAREITMAGHVVLAVNATVLFSDIAGELAKGRPFGACWFERKDGKRQWSLRSDPAGVDVSEVAKRHGGGGHRNSAGFTGE